VEAATHRRASRIELRVGTRLLVSFQRYPLQAPGTPERTPRSFGALPIASGGNDSWLLPIPDGEAVWVGLLHRRRAADALVTASVQLVDGRVLDVATGLAEVTHAVTRGWRVPPATAIAGFVQDGQPAPFTLASSDSTTGARMLRVCAMRSVRRLGTPSADVEQPLFSSVNRHAAIGDGSIVDASSDEWDLASRRCVELQFVTERTFTEMTGLAVPPRRDPGPRPGLLP
jgi:hypothetical protein